MPDLVRVQVALRYRQGERRRRQPWSSLAPRRLREASRRLGHDIRPATSFRGQGTR